MRRMALLSTMSILALGLLAGTGVAWQHMYDCDVFPTDAGWMLCTGFLDEMEIMQDPDDPANNILHIFSKDGSDVPADDGDKTRYERSRPQIRLDHLWEGEAHALSAVTIEQRIRETAGGYFMEPYDGWRQGTLETIAPDVIWIGGSGRQTLDHLDLWRVLRLIVGPPPIGQKLYVDGELFLDSPDVDSEMSQETREIMWEGRQFRNFVRFGHSGGSGPAEGAPSEIYLDYIYFDETGAYPPGEEPWMSVQDQTWGKIKAQF